MNRNQLVRDLRSMGLVVSNAPGDSPKNYGITANLNTGIWNIASCIKATADAGNYRVVYGLTCSIETHEDPTVDEADWEQFLVVWCQLRTRL